MIAQLRQALFTRLDARPSALGTKPVYDYVPQGNEKVPPYVAIGDLDKEAQDTDTSDGALVVCSLHLFSQYQGAQEISGMIDAVTGLLHHYALPVTGSHVILVTVDDGDIQTGADGVTRESIVRVHVLLDDIT